jgi:hypothetical protein
MQPYPFITHHTHHFRQSWVRLALYMPIMENQ